MEVLTDPNSVATEVLTDSMEALTAPNFVATSALKDRNCVFRRSTTSRSDSYDRVLEAFSKPLSDFISWSWTQEQEIVVTNDTGDLYRYFDATLFAEYFYDRVADTVRHDLKEELGFVAVFDRAFNAVREIVDMPDRRASLFVRLCMQNGGHIASGKRAQFPELTDSEVAQLQLRVREAMAAEKASCRN